MKWNKLENVMEIEMKYHGDVNRKDPLTKTIFDTRPIDDSHSQEIVQHRIIEQILGTKAPLFTSPDSVGPELIRTMELKEPITVPTSMECLHRSSLFTEQDLSGNGPVNQLSKS